MNVVAMQAVLSGAAKAAAPHASAGAKWAAVGCGLGVLVVLWVLVAFMSGHRSLRELVNGFDGFGSTSKFQWALWLVVVIFGYSALWVLRALQGDFSALSDIPVNILTVLGFSTGTAAAAKGITASYVQAGKVTKTGAPTQAATAANTGGIFQDDNGGPELAKIQMVGFTLIAIGIFLASVFHQIATDNITASLPNIDSSLLVLMGISQGGYLGKKLVTFGTPSLSPPDPLTGPPSTPVKLAGTNLGSQPGSQLLLDGSPIPATKWSDAAVEFAVPAADPATGADWTALPKAVPVVVSVMGQQSNPVRFTVTAPVKGKALADGADGAGKPAEAPVVG
jgi:hypothetical protein